MGNLRKMQLFFDDKNLLSINGFKRKCGVPKIVELYNDPLAVTPIGYPSVWYDESSELYHMFYNGHINNTSVPLAAVSRDGIHFQPRPSAAAAGIKNAIADTK